MAISITNVQTLSPPLTPSGATAIQGTRGSAFLLALADAANQQASLNNLNLTTQAAQGETSLTPPLLTQLQDTGNLGSTDLQDYPQQSATGPQNQTAGNAATVSTNGTIGNAVNAFTAAFTASGLFLPTLLGQFFAGQTPNATTPAAKGTAATNALNTNGTGITAAQSSFRTATLTGAAAEQLQLQDAAIRLHGATAGQTQQGIGPTANSAVILTGVPETAAALTAPAASTATDTTTVSSPAIPTATASTNDTVANAIITAQSQTIPAQVPIVSGSNERQQAPGEQSPPVPEPVTAAVAAAPLPSSEVGERPVMAGNRLAALAEAVAHQQLVPGTTPPFQIALNQADTQNGAAPEASTRAIGASAQSATSGQAQAGVANLPTPTSVPVSSPSFAAGVTLGSPPTSAPVPGQSPTREAALASTSPKYTSMGLASSPAAEPSRAAVVPATSPVSTLVETPVRIATSAANPTGSVAPTLLNTLVGNLGLINPASFVAASASTATTAASGVNPSVIPFESTAKPDSSGNDVAFAAFASSSTGNLAPSSAASAPTAPQPTLAAQVAEGIVTHAQSSTQNGSTEFRLRLDPPELGAVNVQLVSVGDEVRGHVVVASESVRQMIESQLPELRQRLEAAGVTIQSFDVSTDSSGKGNQNARQETASGAPTAIQTTASTAAASRLRRATTSNSGQLDVMA